MGSLHCQRDRGPSGVFLEHSARSRRDKRSLSSSHTSWKASGRNVRRYNVHTFGGRSGEAGLRMEAIADRFKVLGIPFEIDHVEHQGWMHSLGLHFSFQERCTARAKTDRAWTRTLWCMTRGLLRRRRHSGRLLQVWLGWVNFHFQLLRPALSALSAIYKFIDVVLSGPQLEQRCVTFSV